MTKIRSAYSGSVSVSTVNKDPSRTKQKFAKECDINNIMKRFQRDGALEHYAKHAGWYGEVPAVDLREALEVAERAKQVFEDLPSNVRKRVGDPVGFLEFVQDPANEQEMIELGLKESVQEPVEYVAPGGPGEAPEASPAESGAQ